MTLTASTLATPDDVLQESDRLLELVDGELVEKPVSMPACIVAGKLVLELSLHARERGKPHVVAPEATFQCFPSKPTQVRRPDVAVILASRVPAEGWGDGHTRIRPDVAIEVVSPNETAYDLDAKLLDYEDARVPLVIVINPDSGRARRRVHTGTHPGDWQELRPEESIDFAPVLPDLHLPMASLINV